MDTSFSINNLILVKSQTKLKVFNIQKNIFTNEIKFDNNNYISYYCLTVNKQNNSFIVYVTNDNLINIYSINELDNIYSKQLFINGIDAITVNDGLIVAVSKNEKIFNVIDINNYESIKVFEPKIYNDMNILVDSVTKVNNLSINKKNNFLLFNIDNNTYIYNITNNVCKLIISLTNSSITCLKYSDNYQLILLITNSNYINLYDSEGKLKGTLQVNNSVINIKVYSLCNNNNNIKKTSNSKNKNAKEKINEIFNYIAFAYNSSQLFIYNFELKENNTLNFYSKLAYETSGSNIQNVVYDNSNKLIKLNYFSLVFGSTEKLVSKTISFADYNRETKALILKEGFITIKNNNNSFENDNINNTNNNNSLNNNYRVLNDAEVHTYGKQNYMLKKELLEDNEFLELTNNLVDQNTKLNQLKDLKLANNVLSNNITLLDTLNNALINNDNDKFDWLISQKINIEETVKQLNNEQINSFINKCVERFYSSNNSQYNILLWLELIFKHFLSSMPIDQIKQLESLLLAKTMNYNVLLEAQSKMEILDNIKSIAKEHSNNKGIDTNNKENHQLKPMLVYYESEDEEEKNNTIKYKHLLDNNKKKSNLKKKKVESVESNIDIDEENFDDENDAFEDALNNMDMDALEDLDGNEDEEFEDDYDNFGDE